MCILFMNVVNFIINQINLMNSFIFIGIPFIKLLMYLYMMIQNLFTVAQKIAPMFACYGKTHALLNDYIR